MLVIGSPLAEDYHRLNTQANNTVARSLARSGSRRDCSRPALRTRREVGSPHRAQASRKAIAGPADVNHIDFTILICGQLAFAEERTSLTAAAICFLSYVGLSDSLVTRHQMEVCPLSREVMSPRRCCAQPLSAPLQSGIRFFHPPIPAIPWTRLAARLPSGRSLLRMKGNYGLTTFRVSAGMG
jgi:hypothetical protein